jgi:hypothetical protein
VSEYAEQLDRLRPSRPALAGELAAVRTLERLLDWLRARGLDFAALDMVTQDEYCHDLLVPLGGPGEWLAVGMT